MLQQIGQLAQRLGCGADARSESRYGWLTHRVIGPQGGKTDVGSVRQLRDPEGLPRLTTAAEYLQGLADQRMRRMDHPDLGRPITKSILSLGCTPDIAKDQPHKPS